MIEEIFGIVSPHIPTQGLVVVEAPSTGDVLVVFANGEVKQYSSGRYREWGTLPEEAQMFWYAHIVDNQQLLDYYLRENVIEFDAEFLEKGNATEIAGEDGTIIAHLVDVGTEDGDTTINSVVFHSPDGTFSTLTAWVVGEKGSKEVAGKDLRRIAEEIVNYANTHFADEETLE